MGRVGSIVRRTRDVDRLLVDLLDELLDLFHCERAWLLYPCDPAAAEWRVPIERTRAEWPGAFDRDAVIPMDDASAEVFREALAEDAPLAYDEQSGRRVPTAVAEAFGIRAQMIMAVDPKVGSPWLLGIHHCAEDHIYTEEEQRIFEGTCRRIAPALGTLLLLRDLKNSESRFRTLVEHAPEAVVVMDAEGRFLDANSNAASLFGLAPEELLRREFAELTPPDEEGGPGVAAALAGHFAKAQAGAVARFPWTLLGAGGRSVRCEVSLVRLADGPDSRIRASIVDITEREQLSEQLRHLETMRAVGELAGGVAHDFNNLLVVILCHADILGDLVDPPTGVREAAEAILGAAQTAAGLTQELLAFSRRSALEPSAVDVGAVVEKAAAMLERLVGTRVELSVSRSPAAAVARVDEAYLSQVLVNLVTNARDALPEGGRIEVGTTRMDLGLRDPRRPVELEPGRYVALTVQDDGIGMDEQTRERIFDPFFTTKAVGRGTGLGLSTVHGVIRQSGGAIVVQSEPGGGSIFTVLLPEADSGPVFAGPAQAAAVAETRSARILLVDDHEGVCHAAATVLRGRGYSVVEALSGEQALAIVEGGRSFDLLLSDVVMPGMGGVELASRVLRIHPDTAVLLSSGYSEGVAGQLDDSGVYAQLLPKPYTSVSLLERVREVLDARAGPALS